MSDFLDRLPGPPPTQRAAAAGKSFAGDLERARLARHADRLAEIRWRDLPPAPEAEEAAEQSEPEREEVAAIRRALLEEPQKLEALDEAPAREPLPGTAELLYRGQSAVLFSERGHGKSTVALVLGLSHAAAGGRVLYWDRENGGQLTRARVEAMLDANPEWGDPLETGRFVSRHYPRLDPHWEPADLAAALADFTVVVWDSLREAIAQLGGDPNSEADISCFATLCVSPLVSQGAAVLVLDNVGHEAQHRPRGRARSSTSSRRPTGSIALASSRSPSSARWS